MRGVRIVAVLTIVVSVLLVGLGSVAFRDAFFYLFLAILMLAMTRKVSLLVVKDDWGPKDIGPLLRTLHGMYDGAGAGASPRSYGGQSQGG